MELTQAHIQRYGPFRLERTCKGLEFLQRPTSLLDQPIAGGDAAAWFGRLPKEALTPGMVRRWIGAA